MSRSCRALLLTTLLLTQAGPVLAASDVDILVQRLVEKGILTEAEAGALITEMSDARGALPVQDLAAAPAVAAAAPATTWADRINVTGDLRTRYQTENLDHAPTDGSMGMDRARIRWRLGTDAAVADRWTVGFGVASGGTDARSTNQTLNNGFSRGDARLDYAYARYAAGEQLEMLGGKFKNPLWTPKDLLWDTDIRPDGVAARYSMALGDGIDAFVVPAYLVLDERIDATQDAISMWVLQTGATFALGERTALTLAPAYYAFANIDGAPAPVDVSVQSNSRDADGNLLYDFDALAAGASLAVKDVGPLQQLSIFGEYVNSLDPDEDDTGYLVGFSIGDPKIADFGDWQIVYNYRRLEKDAWPEFLSDADALFGATDVRGDEVEFFWGVSRNVSVVANYYSSFEFIGTDTEQDLLQIDLNLKW